ncbi:MAG: deoxyribonuclease V [Gemmatimonadota bacterium]
MHEGSTHKGLMHQGPMAREVSPAEAIAVQKRLAPRVVAEDSRGKIRRIAGVDVHFDRCRGAAQAAVAVLVYPSLERVEVVTASRAVSFPYIAGLFAFRELPPVLEALAGLGEPPDLLLCDGHGVAHPRRFGLACHLGLLTDTPAIGVAKSLLVGHHAPLPPERGASRRLVDGEETVGMALRTRSNVKPVYVSVGHRICLASALEYVLRCSPRFRLPEPIRQAHHFARRPRARTGEMASEVRSGRALARR